MQSLLQSWIGCFFAAFLLTACGSGAQGDLDDASQLALEIGIVSTLAGQNAIFNPTPISDSLRNRIEKLGNIQMRNSAYGMMFSDHLISENGGRLMTVEISSPFSASIEVRGGEVGLRDGDIYIVEGTKLTNADGKTFTFMRGKWSAKAGKSAKSKADTIKRITITMNQDLLKALGISDDDVTNLKLAASELFDGYKDAPGNIDELIAKLEVLPIEVGDNTGKVYLRDIALLDVSLAERRPEDTSDIALVLGVSEE